MPVLQETALLRPTGSHDCVSLLLIKAMVWGYTLELKHEWRLFHASVVFSFLSFNFFRKIGSKILPRVTARSSALRPRNGHSKETATSV